MRVFINGNDFTQLLVECFFNQQYSPYEYKPSIVLFRIVYNGDSLGIPKTFDDLEVFIKDVSIFKGKILRIEFLRSYGNQYNLTIIAKDSSYRILNHSAGQLSFLEETTISEILDQLGIEYEVDEDFAVTNTIPFVEETCYEFLQRLCTKYGYVLYNDGFKLKIGRSGDTESSQFLQYGINYEEGYGYVDFEKSYKNITVYSNSFYDESLEVSVTDSRADIGVLENDKIMLMGENSLEQDMENKILYELSKNRFRERCYNCITRGYFTDVNINQTIKVIDSQFGIDGTFFIKGVEHFKTTSKGEGTKITICSFDALRLEGISTTEQKNNLFNKFVGT